MYLELLPKWRRSSTVEDIAVMVVQRSLLIVLQQPIFIEPFLSRRGILSHRFGYITRGHEPKSHRLELVSTQLF